MGAESFTVLAILEARDRASEIFAKVDESLDKFSETATRAGETAKGAGDAIDEALGRDVPASDRLETATARLSAAQARAAASAKALTDAEKGLRDAQAASAQAGDGDAAATARLVEADRALSVAQKDAATSAKGLKDAQAGQATASKAVAAAADESAVAQDRAKVASEGSGLSLGKVGKIAGIAALGMGIAGALMVKAAGNFQDSTTHLVTDAGESAKNLAMVQAGILNVSTATGTSANDITNAMYHIESGGYHGAAGLQLLKVAAEGAKVGGADLDTVSKTLVGTMNAYGMSSSHAAAFMNQLIATVGAGDMRMQDLASSLSAVAPLAAASGISFSQVGGAIATMTAQGMSARQSTQDLANTIRNLSKPNNVAIAEMQQLGLNSQDVAQHLGQRGLTGTIGMLTQAITSHMGPSGMVIQSAFNNATNAAKDAQAEIGAMPASLQGLARQFLAGSVTSKQWSKDLQGLSPIQAHLMSQFATTADKAHSFNSLLTSGSPAAQTYTAALAKMMGGATGLNTALMLSGGRMSVFQANAAAIADAAKKGGNSVANWSTITSTFNFKVDQAKTGLENTGIAIGTALLPAATSLMQVVTRIVTPIAEWTAKNKTLTEVLFVGVAAIAATIAVIAGASKAYKAVSGAVKDVQATVKAAQGALVKLGLISKESAAAQEASAGEAAAAQEGAAAKSSSSWIASSARSAAAAAAGAARSAAAWVASTARTAVAWAASQAQAALSAAGSAASWVAGAATSAAAWASSTAATAAAWVTAQARSAASAASSAASWVAAAATTAAAWVASAASGVASGAMWVAGSLAKVAVMVAANVAGALATAAAWVIANAVMLLGIGLIVIAVIAAVVLIIRYWKQISEFAVKAFHEVLAVVDSVIGWVKSHWPLILAIMTGPVGLAVLFIVDHWRQIVAAVSAAIDWVKAHWPLILAILAGPIGLAVLYIVKHFAQVKAGAAALIGDLVSFFERLPGRILGALGDLAHLLWSAGASIVQGLINGLESQIGAVAHTASSIVSTIKSFLPFSPAERGPLSGSGDPSNSGRSIARNLATGMLSGASYVTGAARHLAGSAALGGGTAGGGPGGGLALPAPGGAAGGGPGVTIVVDVHGNTIMSEKDIDILLGRMGPALTRALGQAGVKVRFG